MIKSYKEMKVEYMYQVYYIDEKGLIYKARTYRRISQITKSIAIEKRWKCIEITTTMIIKFNNDEFHLPSETDRIAKLSYEMGGKQTIEYRIEGQKFDILSTYF